MNLPQFLYAFFFVIVLPALLWLWTVSMEAAVPMPAVHAPVIGLLLTLFGLSAMAWSTLLLKTRGGGLPMNAFPPPRLVTIGPYAFVRDPIYLGFGLICFGVSLIAGKAAGLRFVSPIVVLGMAALVYGYERHDLRRRFGNLPAERTIISLPTSDDSRPRASDRLSVYLLVLLPWTILYEAAVILGPARDAVPGYLPFEHALPVIEWTEAIYFSAYPVLFLAPLLARSRYRLRQFATWGLLASATGFILFLLVPLTAPPRPFVPETSLGRLLLLERSLDTPAAAFPSFHLIWAILAARLISERGRIPAILAWTWTIAIGVSCITTGMHSLIDLIGSVATVLFVARIPCFWSSLRRFSERVANSWRHWRIGPLRIINHGAYAAAGAFIGVLIVSGVTAQRHQAAILTIAVLSVVCAALWAQLVEGSPRLQRPYGYYGSLLGGVIATLMVAPYFHAPVWLLMGAFALAAPWVQALGRLRCLVQGCCHGAPASPSVGIRYNHSRSRVCLFTEYRGVPLHPTQLYSILANVLIGAVLIRLWSLDWPPHLIAGLYLILSSMARFVEESWRGEPQTEIVAGLPVYQWLAIGCLIIGAVMTALPVTDRFPAPVIDGSGLAVAAFFGLLVWAAMSVDFPESNRRFARLSG